MSSNDVKELKKSIESLEKKSNKVNENIQSLNNQFNLQKTEIAEIAKRTPELENEARSIVRKISELRNKAQTSNDELQKLYLQSENNSTQITESTGRIYELVEKIEIEFKTVTEEIKSFRETKEFTLDEFDDIDLKIQEIKKYFENHPDIEDEINEIDGIHEKISDINNKANLTFKEITSKKNEIDKIHKEIFGFEEIDDKTQETIIISGLKTNLINAINGLDDRVFDSETKVNDALKNVELELAKFQEDQIVKSELTLKTWEENFNSLSTQISNLLPNALTAGLSYAFTHKKDDEVKAYEKHKRLFNWGILGMILVSLIPFAVSIYYLNKNVELNIVIEKIPRLVLAILPLYIPVLWLTISANKKMNLAKRLIEEYTHKEVLSKTFEGLSNQIESFGKNDVSEELRLTLIQNFLSMYSENPGKLISDYKNADHPIMEMLENTNRLENSISKLKKIPGMDKIVKILENRVKKNVEETVNRVESGLNTIEDLTTGKQE